MQTYLPETATGLHSGNTHVDATRWRKHSLVGLCNIYDENFRLLLKLMPALTNLRRYAEWNNDAVVHLSMASDEPGLHCQIIDSAPYTTTFTLTHHFAESGGAGSDDGWLPDPDLTVRVYLDARQAETLDCGRNAHCEILRQFRGNARSAVERRWQVNMLLNKWLHHLLARGHRFPVLA